MTVEIDVIMEDDSDSWQAQLQLEEQRAEEKRPSLRKLTERLRQAIALLNVLDPEIQLLRDRMLTLQAHIEKESDRSRLSE